MKAFVRSLIERSGYLLFKRRYMSYGIDPWTDVERLCSFWNLQIKTVFDVGANTGQAATAIMARFPNADVYSFEPHADTHAELAANFQGDRRLKPVNLALGREQGNAKLFAYDSSKINSLVPDAPYAVRFSETGIPCEVDVDTLDHFRRANDVDHIDLLKIDTEGFDVAVLEGARDTLAKRAISFIYLEFNRVQPFKDATGGSLAEMSALLEPAGYSFIASYTDYIVPHGEFFTVCNALFGLSPHSRSNGRGMG